MSFKVAFFGISPGAVETREVAAPAPQGLAIPDDAMRFQFMEGDGRPVGPRYYVTEGTAIGRLHALRAEYPDDRIHGETDGALEFARISWTVPGDGLSGGSMFVALKPGVGIVERRTGRVVWPRGCAPA